MTDEIAVHTESRGHDIGTELLNRIVSYATNNDYRSVRPDVIGSNAPARMPYERLGFKVTRESRFPYLSDVAGFGGLATMEHSITPGN